MARGAVSLGLAGQGESIGGSGAFPHERLVAAFLRLLCAGRTRRTCPVCVGCL